MTSTDTHNKSSKVAATPEPLKRRKRKRKKTTEKTEGLEPNTQAEVLASTSREAPSQNWENFLKLQQTCIPKYGHRYGGKAHASAQNTKNIKYSTDVTDVVGIDCEMVGGGEKGRENLLARVSVVNKYGDVLYNTFVKPINDTPVTDYRTRYSGVRPADLLKGKDFKEVQFDVAKLLKNRIVVGHDLKNDFKVLFFSHPRRKIRDTAKCKLFRQYSNGNTRPSLKTLADKILDIKIQKGEHDSIEDAKAAVAIYMMHQKEWEKSLATKNSQKGTASEAPVVKPHSSRALLMENTETKDHKKPKRNFNKRLFTSNKRPRKQ